MRDNLDFGQTAEKQRNSALWIREALATFLHTPLLFSHSANLAIATGIANIWARDARAGFRSKKNVFSLNPAKSCPVRFLISSNDWVTADPQSAFSC
jgi:hypothetical protein